MRATTTTTGPNNASRVVWALGEFFYFISFIYWYLMNDASRYYRIQATARRRDPHDGYTVVWVLGLKTHQRLEPRYHHNTVHDVCIDMSPHHHPSPRWIGNERMTMLGTSNGRGSRRISSPRCVFFSFT